MYRRTPIFFRIMDSFFRHQLLFWGALLIVSSLTMAALYARSKTFHATAMTQVQTESVAAALGAGDTNTWVTPSQKHIDRFNDLIKQNQPNGFLATALHSANLATPINVDPHADDPRYAMLQKNLSASADSANQFSINLTWDNAEETRTILDALQKQYIEEVGLDRSANSLGVVNFLKARIAEVQKQLETAERALAKFKTSNGGQLSEAESADNNQLNSFRAQLADHQITLGNSGRRKAALQQQLALMKPMSIAKQTVSDQSPLEKAIAGLLAQREVQLTGPGAKTLQHPDIMALSARISLLQKQQRADAAVPGNRHNTLTEFQDNPQYQGLNLQITDASIAQESEMLEIQNLNRQIAKYEALVRSIPAAQRQLVDKTRNYALLQDNYNGLNKKLADAQLDAILNKQTASGSLKAVGVIYATPTTGKTKLIAMLLGSLLLGFVVGVILIVLSEWSDHSLRHEADAERLLGVPVLAALPESADLRTATARRALSGAGASALPGPMPEGL